MKICSLLIRKTLWMNKILFACVVWISTTSAISYSSYVPESSVINLSQYEQRIYSQNGEDGITKKIFEAMGIDSGYYVEFGVEDGKECNTRFLREAYNWNGLMMDGGYENLSINLQKEFITAENINDLFVKYEVPDDFDLLSIDLDYNDFYVWKAIEDHYQPKVVIIEYNATHLPNEDKVIYYDANNGWDRTNYYGASLLAMYNLGREKGYSLVYAERNGVNCFFIRDDILANLNFYFLNVNDVQALYKKPRYGYGPNGGHIADPLNRPYLDSMGQPICH